MSRHVLNGKQRFALTNYVNAEYVKQAVTDVEFAALATAALGFHVNSNNVESCRGILEIPSTRFAGTDQTVIDRLRAVETQAAELAASLEAQAKQLRTLEGELRAHLSLTADMAQKSQGLGGQVPNAIGRRLS